MCVRVHVFALAYIWGQLWAVDEERRKTDLEMEFVNRAESQVATGP